MNTSISLGDYVKHKKSNLVYYVGDSGVERDKDGSLKPAYDCFPIRKRANPTMKGHTFFRYELTKQVKGGIIA